MRSLILETKSFLVAAACSLLFVQCSDSSDRGRTKYDNMGRLMEWEFERTKDPATNIVPTHRLLDAKRIRDERLEAMLSMRSPVPGISWQERGPSNIGGRTRALIFDLGDAANGYRKVWAAGVSGGLWFTNDITSPSVTWSKVNDLFDNLAISSIAQDPSNPLIMYFATGEGWFNSDAAQGAGIWKTTDGGNTWAHLASTSNFYYVQDILFDKSSQLYASVRKNGSPSSTSGIQRSTDGGATWTTVLTNTVASTDQGGDLELAANGDIYATMGTLASNGGIYRSSYGSNGVNTGSAGTWVNITTNSSGVISTPTNLWHRIELACAPSDPDIVYALFQGYNLYNCTSIQQYNATSNSWTVRSVPTIVDQGDNSNFTRGQAWYDLTAAVDPQNASILYIGGIDALRSIDNGSTWTQMSTWSLYNAPAFTSSQYVHADHHAIIYSPGSSSRMLLGTDGGIFYTDNADITGNAKPTFVSKNKGYNVTQYYSVAMHPSVTDYFLAGAQDNGSHKFTTSGINSVEEVSGGDGGYCHIDQDEPQVQITSYVYNNYYVSTNGGTTFTPKFLNNRGGFINSSDYDDQQNILYAGDAANVYFRWSDPANDAIDVAQQVSVPAFNNGSVSHVAVAPVTPNRVFFGLNNGSVVIVDNAHTGASLLGRVIKTGTGSVSCIAIDPVNENHLLVTYSNYGVSSVFESINALAATPTWTLVEGDLPDIPVRWAVFDPRNSDWAILATEIGTWSTNNLNGSSTSWNPTNSGLANVRVEMLQLRDDNTIVAATHGRGLFTASIPNVTTPDINFSSATTSTEENNSITDGCRKYRDYQVQMNIANAPTGSAIVNISVDAGNTAAPQVDFDISTNGLIGVGSTSITFPDGQTNSKTFTVRIYDDAEVESPESFILSYTISGSTNAKKGIGAQTHTISIDDNDRSPVADISSTRQVGNLMYHLGDQSGSWPLDAKLKSQKTQFLYKASELSAAGVAAGKLRSIALYIDKNSTRPYQNLKIKAGISSHDYLVEVPAVYPAVTTTVASFNSYTSIDGWNTFIFDQEFSWNGSDNIVFEICYDNMTADTMQINDLVAGFSDGGTADQGNLFCQSNLTCPDNFTSVGFLNNGLKPAIRILNETPGTSVSNSLGSVSTFINETNDLFAYDHSGRIVARVRNLTPSHSYGCTEILIDRAGSGATAFWNNNVENKLMDKTFRIIPANNNTLGNYQLTLYYTAEEVAGWEAATGQSFENIQLIKTAGRISDVTPTTPAAAGDVYIVTPVIGTLGTNRTLTYTFTNGFSGFGAGVAGTALPITLVDFKGSIKGKETLLEWSTSFEYENRGFDIEKSYDGNEFKKIAHISSGGNSVTGHRYIYTDKDLRQDNNYYRLRQFDIDGRSSFSKVVLIKDPSVFSTGMKLLTNPVHSSLDVQFDLPLDGNSLIRIYDASGKVLFNKTIHTSKVRRLRIPVMQSFMTKGTYVLEISNHHKKYVLRFLK